MITTHKQTRLDYIDLLKGVGIFLVVWGHTMIPRSIYIYSFHMPLFFFLSGFLYKQKPFREFMPNKINTLYVPYVTFSIFSWLFYLIRMITNDQTALIDSHLLKITSVFTGTANNGGNNPIWFLTCLLMVNLLFFVLQKFSSKPYVLGSAVIACSIIGYALSILHIGDFYFNAEIAFSGLVFFYLGYLVKQYNVPVFIQNIKNIVLLVFVLFIEALHIFTAFLNVKISGITHVNMAGNVLGNYFLFYFSACCAILVFLIIGYKVSSINFLNYLGVNTLIILGIHKPVLIVLNDFVNNFINIKMDGYGFYASVLAILLALLISNFTSKYLPQFTGKRPLIPIS